MNLYKTIYTFEVEYYDLGTWFNHFQTFFTKKIIQKNEIKISAHSEWKKVTSRAELKILQLEPARLGLITSTYTLYWFDFWILHSNFTCKLI